MLDACSAFPSGLDIPARKRRICLANHVGRNERGQFALKSFGHEWSLAKLTGCRVAESRFERELVQRCLQSPKQLFGNLPVYSEFGIGLKGTHRGPGS